MFLYGDKLLRNGAGDGILVQLMGLPREGESWSCVRSHLEASSFQTPFKAWRVASHMDWVQGGCVLATW